jgi:outer membrane lipoprotein-sorting protein
MKYFFFFCLGWLSFARADLTQTVETNLTSIKTMEARFSHVDSGGKSYKGTLYLKKPGKLKLVYDSPSPFLIVSDGSALIYEDHETFEATYLPLEVSPLSFLLDQKTGLKKAFQIERVWEEGDLIFLSCRDKKNYFHLTLSFSKTEKNIVGWKSIDAQGNEIDIHLSDIKKNLDLRDDLFLFQQKPRWKTRTKERKEP